MKVESPAWAYAVQWHPEDNWHESNDQLGIFAKLVHEAAGRLGRLVSKAQSGE
jgi:gamma-glutamyl-gamma-aminobutyrate hydrolase PuuD